MTPISHYLLHFLLVHHLLLAADLFCVAAAEGQLPISSPEWKTITQRSLDREHGFNGGDDRWKPVVIRKMRSLPSPPAPKSNLPTRTAFKPLPSHKTPTAPPPAPSTVSPETYPH
ncbi:OLC1v1026509C1 [Oldenlandia corymbosa var. corymbosa]|uniref:OLC1v1026509C1 n=1 Tax=Oldenlandia corymbosa var. corymbosa TaxID=529605 RepID=A0AAV1C985_OLDCO|nr:OLC1v1026509C1 [Oldenlandia corymbosa var. corymbosa]